MEIHDFQVLNLMEGGNQIAATIKIDFTVKETGERVRDEEIHLWTFDDAGKISGMRHYRTPPSTSRPRRDRSPKWLSPVRA